MMAEHDLRTASPAQIRERIGVFWSLGEAQDALAARRLQPLFTASDAEIEKAFVAERLPIRLVLPWILYRNRRLAYVASIALEETRQAITSPSLRTSADMKMSWSNALYALWNRLAANDGVVAYDGETSIEIIPADKWPQLRFMVCKDVGYGKSSRAVGYPCRRDADKPLNKSCGINDPVYEDVWLSRADVLREWPENIATISAEAEAHNIDRSVLGGKASGITRRKNADARFNETVLALKEILRTSSKKMSMSKLIKLLRGRVSIAADDSTIRRLILRKIEEGELPSLTEFGTN